MLTPVLSLDWDYTDKDTILTWYLPHKSSVGGALMWIKPTASEITFSWIQQSEQKCILTLTSRTKLHKDSVSCCAGTGSHKVTLWLLCLHILLLVNVSELLSWWQAEKLPLFHPHPESEAKVRKITRRQGGGREEGGKRRWFQRTTWDAAVGWISQRHMWVTDGDGILIFTPGLFVWRRSSCITDRVSIREDSGCGSAPLIRLMTGAVGLPQYLTDEAWRAVPAGPHTHKHADPAPLASGLLAAIYLCVNPLTCPLLPALLHALSLTPPLSSLKASRLLFDPDCLLHDLLDYSAPSLLHGFSACSRFAVQRARKDAGATLNLHRLTFPSPSPPVILTCLSARLPDLPFHPPVSWLMLPPPRQCYHALTGCSLSLPWSPPPCLREVTTVRPAVCVQTTTLWTAPAKV